ncbi:MAG: hypothetical protein ABI832_08780 [bacterium]
MTLVEKEQTRQQPDRTARKRSIAQRLAADPRLLATERGVLPDGSDARIAALLKEIDETVLPRVLCIKDAKREIALLVVSHRRLIDVDMPGRAALPRESDTLPTRLANRLAEVAARPGAVSLSITRRPSHSNHAEAAVSVQVLSQALVGSKTRERFELLCQLVSDHRIAHVAWSESSPQMSFSGPKDWSPTLMTMAQDYRSTTSNHNSKTRLGLRQTEGVAFQVGPQHIVMIARFEQSGFLALLPQDKGLEALEAWQIR